MTFVHSRPLRAHLANTTILKGWESLSPATVLRGTSYPGGKGPNILYPERLVSDSPNALGGTGKTGSAIADLINTGLQPGGCRRPFETAVSTAFACVCQSPVFRVSNR